LSGRSDKKNRTFSLERPLRAKADAGGKFGYDCNAEILLKKSVEMAFWDRWLAEAPAFYAAAGLSFASLRRF
jgi:hypothetical protein